VPVALDPVEALRPFAEYAFAMQHRWTARDDSAFYGAKRPSVRNVTYGDFRRAMRVVHEADDGKETTVSIRIVTVKLKGPWAPADKDWDRGIVREQSAATVSIADNEYGLNTRSYPMGNVARIEETGHW
jgi:hypothetical protein